MSTDPKARPAPDVQLTVPAPAGAADPHHARFRSAHDSVLVPVDFEGRIIHVPAGSSVAAALLAVGVSVLRTTPASAAPRAPYCMMGVCFECLLEIDGVPNRQACLVPVQAGMRLVAQHGARGLPHPADDAAAFVVPTEERGAR